MTKSLHLRLKQTNFFVKAYIYEVRFLFYYIFLFFYIFSCGESPEACVQIRDQWRRFVTSVSLPFSFIQTHFSFIDDEITEPLKMKGQLNDFTWFCRGLLIFPNKPSLKAAPLQRGVNHFIHLNLTLWRSLPLMLE